MNFATLKIEIEEATKQAFTEMFEKYGKDEIYAFALYSDEGAMTVCPSTNTIKYLEKQALKDPEEYLYYKFEPAEWQCEMEGADELFDEISTMCSETVLDLDDNDFETFQSQLYEVCISVLEKLKSENFFRQLTGKNIFLFFTVTDYEFSKKDLKKIFTRLNDDEYKPEFLNWLKTL